MKNLIATIIIFLAVSSCKSPPKEGLSDKSSTSVNTIYPVAGNYILLKDGSFFKISEGDFFIVNKK